MVNESKLSDVLSEFARTMITDFPIQRIFDRLVDRIVEVLPVTSAGVTLISEGSAPHYIAASNEAARRFERLQTEIGEGPCIEAFTTGEHVGVPDLAIDRTFPHFSPAGAAAGLRAVFTFPLCHGEERFGALDLYRDTPGELDADDILAAQTLADVAAALLLNATAREVALEASDAFHHNSMHDSLTELPNRVLLLERLEHAALRAQRAHTYTAVLFLDLDRFKQVNDEHGHTIGDELLRAVAVRLSSLVRSGDTLARVSGDEFVFLCEDLKCLGDVTALVERIDHAFARPFALDGIDVAVRTSVGVAYVGAGEAITSDLLRRADLDMYRAKREGSGAAIIEVTGARASADDLGFEDELRLALFHDELDVAYQPIVRATDGRIVGVETLLRWTSPRRGSVSPLLIVSVAERTGLICEIGERVLERACRDYTRWTKATRSDTLDLAVNVSVRQLMAPDFCGTVESVLERTGMDPRSLVLELTESIAMEHSVGIMDTLVGVTALGARWSLDDFGTGYSSLSYLSRLPIRFLKIDRDLITELDQPGGKTVVVAVTALAHQLGLTVIAEGVETPSQRDSTIAAGCDLAQGYLFARPMTAEAIEHLLINDEPLCRPAIAAACAAGSLSVR